MITIFFLLLLAALYVLTPWREFPRLSRGWALTAALNTILFSSMPTTMATSPWRPIVHRFMLASMALSLILFATGLILWRRNRGLKPASAAWIAPLVIAILPVALWGFFWIIGPMY